MALFVAQLAFADPQLLAGAKTGILSASFVAGLLGLAAGRLLLRPFESTAAAGSTDEAERSTAQC
jgi:NhaA family Na+:H+ antiporter